MDNLLSRLPDAGQLSQLLDLGISSLSIGNISKELDVSSIYKLIDEKKAILDIDTLFPDLDQTKLDQTKDFFNSKLADMLQQLKSEKLKSIVLDIFTETLFENNLPLDIENLSLDFKGIVSNIKDNISNLNIDLLPVIQEVNDLKALLNNLKDENIDNIYKSAQEIIDSIRQNAKSILYKEDILSSIDQFTNNAAANIQTFLESFYQKADKAALSISDNIENDISVSRQFIAGEFTDNLTSEIKGIGSNIIDFLDQIDIEPALSKISEFCSMVTSQLDAMFSAIKQLKTDVNDAVLDLQDKIEENKDTTESELIVKLDYAKSRVDEFLSQIADVFQDQEIIEAVDTIKDAAKTFKTKIKALSFEDVFELVSEKTKDVKKSIESIDVGSLGAAQKIAIKAAIIAINEVSIPDIVKPKLMDIFTGIQSDLLDGFYFIKDKVCNVKELIDEFDPGTIAATYILESNAYKSIIDDLESFKPSQLLSVFQKAVDYAAEFIDKIDPNIFIDKLQDWFDDISKTIDFFSPKILGDKILSETDILKTDLQDIKNNGIKELRADIKSFISLESLIETSGAKEIFDIDFSSLTKEILDDFFLNNFTYALDQAEKELAAFLENYGAKDADLQKLSNLLEKQAKPLITNIREMLTPYADFADKFTDVLNEIESTTAKIENRLDSVITDAFTSISSIIDETLDVIETLKETVLPIIEEIYETLENKIKTFSPQYILNRLSENSFFSADSDTRFNAALKESLNIDSELDALDTIYTTVVDKVKNLPITKIKEPLDAKFNEIKAYIDEILDIEESFDAIEEEINALDDELCSRLDKTAKQYDLLLKTLYKKV